MFFKNRKLAEKQPQTGKNRKGRKLALESLQKRELMAADLWSNGTLNIEGSSLPDVIMVDEQRVLGRGWGRHDVHVEILRFGTTVYAETFDGFDVERIRVNGRNGSDNISNNTAFPSTLIGEYGADVLTGGSSQDEIWGFLENISNDPFADSDNTLNGRGGNDDLYGGGGADTIDGGEGHDAIKGAGGNDILHGGAGDDTIGGSHDNDFIHGGDGEDTIVGGSGDDLIYGGDDDDEINGDNGRDEIYGGIGDDIIHGDGYDATLARFYSSAFSPQIGFYDLDLADEIYGGPGNDEIYGNSGPDVIFGGSGNDDLFGGTGRDQIFGMSGRDEIEGGMHNDALQGGSGNDVISGGQGADIIYGDFGFDGAFGHSWRNYAKINDTQSEGRDVLNGDADHDAIHGDGGNDELNGGSGQDQLYGDGGHDELRGDSGADMMWGGSGTDELYFNYLDLWVDIMPGKDWYGIPFATSVNQGESWSNRQLLIR